MLKTGADPGEGHRGQMTPLQNHAREAKKLCIGMKIMSLSCHFCTFIR